MGTVFGAKSLQTSHNFSFTGSAIAIDFHLAAIETDFNSHSNAMFQFNDTVTFTVIAMTMKQLKLISVILIGHGRENSRDWILKLQHLTKNLSKKDDCIRWRCVPLFCKLWFKLHMFSSNSKHILHVSNGPIFPFVQPSVRFTVASCLFGVAFVRGCLFGIAVMLDLSTHSNCFGI